MWVRFVGLSVRVRLSVRPETTAVVLMRLGGAASPVAQCRTFDFDGGVENAGSRRDGDVLIG